MDSQIATKNYENMTQLMALHADICDIGLPMLSWPTCGQKTRVNKISEGRATTTRKESIFDFVKKPLKSKGEEKLLSANWGTNSNLRGEERLEKEAPDSARHHRSPSSSHESRSPVSTGDSSGAAIPQSSSGCGLDPTRPPWFPGQSDELIHNNYLSNGELSEKSNSHVSSHLEHLQLLAKGLSIHRNEDSRSHIIGNGLHTTYPVKPAAISRHRSSVESSSSDSSEETREPAPRTMYKATVLRNPRSTRNSRTRAVRPAKTYTTTLNLCCATPQIKLTCACCNEQTFVKVKEELMPRVIPVATSQLGFCRFCQSNGDPAEVYQGHSLRSDDGKVTCPVLREYNCPICNNGGGDFAHTIKYCPLARKAKPGQVSR